ncbi:adenylate cyclase [Acrasis kona]
MRSSLVDGASAAAKTLYSDLKFTQVATIWQSNSSYWTEAKNGFHRYANEILKVNDIKDFTISDNYLSTISSYQGVIIFADFSISDVISVSINNTNPNVTIVTMYDNAVPTLLNSKSNFYVSMPFPESTIDSGYNEAYILTYIINNALSEVTTVNYTSLMDALYRIQVFNIDGYPLGPIGPECVAGTCSDYCDCNQMAHQANVISSKNTFTLSFSSCGITFPIITYTFPPFYIVLIVVLTLILIIIIITAILGALYYKINKVNLSNAPKTGYMVLAFTDVQNSTKLWSQLGTDMSKALSVHNKVLRNLIKKYKGYEVKTQGDSFMVAFEDPKKAVEWALHSQKDLLYAEWPPCVMQTFDCRIEWDEYESVLFRGPRVRMGLHYGYAERVYDVVTKRYDYFGNTVNCAARVESQAKGGQIYISEDLLDRVKNDIDMIDVEQYSCMLQETRLLSNNELNGLIGETFQLSQATSQASFDVVQQNQADLPNLDDLYAKPYLPNLPRDNKLNEAILYRLKGSFLLKGISGNVNLYEVMSENLVERDYDTKKSNHSSRRSSISAFESSNQQLSKYVMQKSDGPENVAQQHIQLHQMYRLLQADKKLGVRFSHVDGTSSLPLTPATPPVNNKDYMDGASPARRFSQTSPDVQSNESHVSINSADNLV